MLYCSFSLKSKQIKTHLKGSNDNTVTNITSIPAPVWNLTSKRIHSQLIGPAGMTNVINTTTIVGQYLYQICERKHSNYCEEGGLPASVWLHDD